MDFHPGIKWGCLVFLAVVVMVVAVIFIHDTSVPSSARRALPKSAANIREYYSDSWNGDFIRLIRADLRGWDDYIAYAKTLGFSERYSKVKHADIKTIIGMGAGNAPGWWTPPPVDENTFF
jgi:hypothetical protein